MNLSAIINAPKGKAEFQAVDKNQKGSEVVPVTSPYFSLKRFHFGSFRQKKTMTSSSNNSVSEQKRLDQIPILHVRGTHYTCGYTIGRQFGRIIEDLMCNWDYLNNKLLPVYETPKGHQIYDSLLALCTQKFPGYVDELKGMSDGAKVPFFKLFLLHIDTIIVPHDDNDSSSKTRGSTGCTTVLSNHDEVILGHTEDALPEMLNHVYIISAEIVSDSGEKLEKFTTLTYAGHLPGYTMGYNENGLIYSVNSIFLKTTYANRTPKMFLARALLGAANLVEVLDILRDAGSGSADGFSLNITFAKQEGSPVMHNVEVGPGKEGKCESELSVLTLTHGDFHAHCNKYLRLQIPEASGIAIDSSNHRHKAIGRHLRPNTTERIKEVLSDQTDEGYPVFRGGTKPPDCIKTVAVGIFDITQRKWAIYTEPPRMAAPIVEFYMEF